MTKPRYAAVPLLALLGSLAASQGIAAGRDGRDYVIDSQRGAPRTGLLGQCIRTGVPDAGAAVEDCTGGAARTAAPAAAPAPGTGDRGGEAVVEPAAAAASAEGDGSDAIRHYEEESRAAGDDGIVRSEVNEAFEAEQAAALAEAERQEEAERAAAARAEADRLAAERAEAERLEAETVAAERAAAERLAAERAAERLAAERAAAERAEADRLAAARAAAPAAQQAEPPSVARMTLTADADFDFNKSALRPAGRKKLDEFAEVLKTTEYGTIRVVGHTDRIGSREANRRLSLRRAQAVKDHLVSRGIEATRIAAEGMAFDQPLTKPEDCKGLNKKARIACYQPDRRVEVDAQAMRVVQR